MRKEILTAFTRAAAVAVPEIADQLPEEERQALNEHLANGFRVGLAMVADGAGKAEIWLLVIDGDDGLHRFCDVTLSEVTRQ